MLWFKPVKHWINHRPLAAYLLLTFGLEWLLLLALQSVAAPVEALFISGRVGAKTRFILPIKKGEMP